MKRFAVLVLVVVVSLVLVLGGCGKEEPAQTTEPTTTTETPAAETAEVINWNAQAIFPAEDLCYKTQATTIVNTINERLDGRLHIELYQPDMLVPVMEQFSACAQGVFEVNITAFDYDSQWVPEAMVAFSLPGAWQNLDQCLAFFDDYGGLEFFREGYEGQNMYLLRNLPYGRDCLMTKEELKSLDDLHGKKMWAPAPKAQLMQEMGSLPVEMPIEELYMSLKLGTIDQAIYSLPELKTLNLYEVVDYVYLPAIVPVLNVSISLNLDAWNALDPALRAEIEAIMDEINPQMFNAIAAEEQVGLDLFESKEGTVIEMPEDWVLEFHETGRETWDIIADEGPRVAEAVDLVRAFVEAEGIQ